MGLTIKIRDVRAPGFDAAWNRLCVDPTLPVKTRYRLALAQRDIMEAMSVYSTERQRLSPVQQHELQDVEFEVRLNAKVELRSVSYLTTEEIALLRPFVET